jgi:hypothetical protein
MNWVKVGLIAVGALIAFVVVESLFHLLEWAFIILAIGVVIAVAVKARHEYKLAMQRRAQVKAEKAERKAQVRERRGAEVTPAPTWIPEDTPSPRPAAQATAQPRPAAHNVEDELARLKREMGAS